MEKKLTNKQRRNKERYLRNKERMLAQSKAYYESHKEERKKYIQSEQVKEMHKGYIKKYLSNPENKNVRLEYQAEYRKNNKEKATQYRKDYRERRNKKHAERMIQDPLYKAKCAIRCVVRTAFNRIGKNKPTKTARLLGCNWEEAKAHIENLFQEGMSWDNHGKWHIDHIRPVASFEEHELHLMNNISNLQPLWSIDNLSKSDKWN